MERETTERVSDQFERFSRELVQMPLRSYQLEAARAILESIERQDGAVFTIMMARQMGKNELSSQIEAWLLQALQSKGASLIKAAPTLRPQGLLSKRRLRDVLYAINKNEPGRLAWREREGTMIQVGDATITFYSAEKGANVVGATANPLLEVDEAQNVSEAKYLRDFRPMGASTNATTVLYGTAWTGETLLERQKQINLEQEARAAKLAGTRNASDGPSKRHFEYPWTVWAEHSPLYRAYVEAEIERLGLEHPMIRTQYLLESLTERDRLLSAAQLAQLRGTHPRLRAPETLPGRPALYVAGVDVAGADEGVVTKDGEMVLANPQRDATVVTIAQVSWDDAAPAFVSIRLVEQYEWVGLDYRQQYLRLHDLLRGVWNCQHVVIDASGIGAGLAAWLEESLGEHIVESFQFTATSKSTLGWDLLAAVNTGRLKMYADDGSPESRHFWDELRLARSVHLAHQRMNFFVPDGAGHDDYLISAALCVRAAMAAAPAPVSRVVAPRRFYRDGTY
ncbi:MAG TPA: hypothetical protein VH540_08310 [Ktedonobacterales bacterium]